MSKEFKGTMIITKYNSSNIQAASYDTSTKAMRITFNSGATYEYDDVPHEIFSAFDNAESQGKHFNSAINKIYKHKKI